MKEHTVSFKEILGLFLIWRIFDLVVIFLSDIFPKWGFFPYKETALSYHLPEFLTELSNFDGVQYLIIAKEGYYTYNQAYFPLYPLTIRVLAPIFLQNYLVAAIVV